MTRINLFTVSSVRGTIIPLSQKNSSMRYNTLPITKRVPPIPLILHQIYSKNQFTSKSHLVVPKLSTVSKAHSRTPTRKRTSRFRKRALEGSKNQQSNRSLIDHS